MGVVALDQHRLVSAGKPIDHRSVHARAIAKAWHPSRVFEPFPVDDLALSIPKRFAKTVAAYPNRSAVVFGDETYTFAQFNNAANVVAQFLLDELGQEPQPVSMLFDQSAAMLIAIMGILKAGKFYVPLSPHDPPQRWRQILADVEAPILLFDDSNRERVSGLSTVDMRLKQFEVLELDRPALDPDIEITSDAYAYVLYTSGSTGVPKGVIGHHRNVLLYSKNVINHIHLCPHDRSAMVQSISFSGSQNAIFPPLFTGAASYVFDVHKEGLHALAEWLAREKITFLHGSMVFLAMTEFMDDTCTLPSMRIVYGGAGPTYRRQFETFRRVFSDNCVYVSSYGATEMLGMGRMLVDSEYEMDREILPVGFQDDEIEILIWDDDGNPVREGEAGEIVVRTRFLTDGYWRRPDLTAERFVGDPDNPGQRVYRTGDVGRLMEDGCLEHLGRLDHQVKVRGHRVETGEVESRLLSMDNIREAAVHAVHGDHGVVLVAYVVGYEARPNVETLRNRLADELPDYAIPQRFVILDRLPRLRTGKIDYKGLPAPGRERPEMATPYAPPTTDLEERLVRVWAEVLDLESVGVDDRFTDLGGDSLSAARLLAALEEMTDRRLPFAVIAEASTVRELTVILDEEQAVSRWRTLVRVQSGNGRPPLFLVPPAASTSIGFTQLAQHLGDEQAVYSFDPLGMNDSEEPQYSVEEMASLYLSDLKQIQPEGPYHLGGRCFGALVAQEMAHQLEKQGDRVNLLVIMDSGAIQAQRELRNESSYATVWQQDRNSIPLHTRAVESLRFRTRKLYQSFMQQYGPPDTPSDEIDARTRRVLNAHTIAWQNHETKPIHAHTIVMACGNFGSRNRHRGWDELTDGAYSEYISEYWPHEGFLSDPANLDYVADILRRELDTPAC